jgi:hypothetical protein
MALLLKTWGEQLQEIQSAISAVLLSQKYSIGNRELQRADLEWLQKREEYLIGKLESEGDIIPAQKNSSRGVAEVHFL